MVVDHDTISAIATARGEASIGVVRVSGPQAVGVASRVFRLSSGRTCPWADSRTVYYGHIVTLDRGDTVDEAITLWMPGPQSYTGEDVVEFQVHGGVRTVEAVLECTLDAGARLAEPGEFTKRAFLNGRIDLSQAEAVMDLIRSKTDLAVRSALSQVRGRFGEKIRQYRKELIGLQAQVEVSIDYPEHDVEAVACQAVVDIGSRLRAEVVRLAASARVADILRDGVKTAIVGRPNVGKSSLLNALLRRDRAIVTDIPGTTRDVLEEFVNLRGIPYRLMDTAGIRETEDAVERIGVARSRQAVEIAELAVVVIDGSEPMQGTDVELLAATRDGASIIVINKSDLTVCVSEDDVYEAVHSRTVPILQVSAAEGDGLEELEETMERLVIGESDGVSESSYFTNARQVALLRQAERDLDLAVDAARQQSTLDIIAVQLQAAYATLGEVIGEAVGEDLLDEIFSRFCLGK